MPIIKTSLAQRIREYLVMTLGVLVFVISWNIFILPNNLVGSGVSGLSSIVYYATNGKINVGYTYFAINVILLLIAIKVLGKQFGGKTVYAIVTASILFRIAPEIIPQDFVQAIAVANGKMISTIIGAGLVGVSIGLTMSVQGSTGGTDIIALIVAKYKNISPGRVVLLIDIIIVTSSFFIPIYNQDGTLMNLTERVATVVYGYIMIVIISFTLDMYLSGTKQSVQVFIFSKKYEELADAITNDLHRGLTVLPGKGWYTKQESNVLLVVTRKADLNMLLKYIKYIDPQAFVSVATVMGVYGQGFDAIKLKAEAKKKEA
ncbi:MAG: YitT family protein [Bacteroidales bacterium]|nr:YitT family protein [Bacteroidales bacterium]